MELFKKLRGVVARAALLLSSVVLALLFYGVFWCVFWPVWCLLVLAGREKAGPRESWTDEAARREFEARRIEVKTVVPILVAYSGTVWCILVALLVDPETYPVLWGSMLGVALVVGCIIMDLVCFRLQGWRQLDDKLTRRYREPVLL